MRLLRKFNCPACLGAQKGEKQFLTMSKFMLVQTKVIIGLVIVGHIIISVT